MPNRIRSIRAKQWKQGFLIGLLLLIIFWLVSLIVGLSGKAQIAIKEAHEAQWQYQELETRKQTLEGNIAALESDRGQDAAIRKAFGVVRPGEEVITVVPPSAPAATSTESWWQRILGWF